jgi:nucleoporin NUP42
MSAPVTSVFGASAPAASPFGTNTLTPVTAAKDGITGTLTPALIASAPSLYQTGVNPYDANLPKNYLELLPESAKVTFAKDMFECGDIPEWIPPMEMR